MSLGPVKWVIYFQDQTGSDEDRSSTWAVETDWTWTDESRP